MLTKENLGQFTGTENYYRHWLNFVYTDGVKFMAEKAGAYWLLDAIGSYQPEVKDIPFQLWKLEVAEDNTAVLTMREDSDRPAIITQKIGFTDFPLPEMKLYFIDGVLLLPSEY